MNVVMEEVICPQAILISFLVGVWYLIKLAAKIETSNNLVGFNS